eukprot:5097091-Lingulodinium_polyedra.AAC.1
MLSVVFPRCHAFPKKDQRQGSNRPEEGDAKEIMGPKTTPKIYESGKEEEEAMPMLGPREHLLRH